MVAHPGTQHSYQTVLALNSAGISSRYLTGFYYKYHSLLARLLSLVPGHLSRRINSYLSRRRSNGISDDQVSYKLSSALLAQIAQRTSFPQAQSLLRIANTSFDHWVIKTIERTNPRVVIGYDSQASAIFEACSSRPVWRLLDQTIGHVLTASPLLEQERQLNPDFAATIPPIPDQTLRQCASEVKNADLILAASDYVIRTLKDLGTPDDKIRFLPYGVDIERFKPVPQPAPKRKIRFLYIGQISQRKGIKYLLEAFKKLGSAQAELHLAGPIFGNQALLTKYRDMINYHGSVPREQIPELYQSADIFVFPSLHEGSALVVYEALASGLPVITTFESGSVVRNGTEGFLVPMQNSELLAEKMELLLTNSSLREQLGRQGRSRAEQFPWSRYHRELGGIVRELLEREPRKLS